MIVDTFARGGHSGSPHSRIQWFEPATLGKCADGTCLTYLMYFSWAQHYEFHHGDNPEAVLHIALGDLENADDVLFDGPQHLVAWLQRRVDAWVEEIHAHQLTPTSPEGQNL